jgi:hypothetical protein
VSTTLSDHLSEIFLGHTQLEDVSVISHDLFDLDLFRLVHERLYDRHDERLHWLLRERFTGRARGLRTRHQSSTTASSTTIPRAFTPRGQSIESGPGDPGAIG